MKLPVPLRELLPLHELLILPVVRPGRVRCWGESAGHGGRASLWADGVDDQRAGTASDEQGEQQARTGEGDPDDLPDDLAARQLPQGADQTSRCDRQQGVEPA